jgi:hypothetical protein
MPQRSKTSNAMNDIPMMNGGRDMDGIEECIWEWVVGDGRHPSNTDTC